MARLPANGASFLTPFDNGKNPRALDDNDLRAVLFDICPGVTFTPDEINEYLLGLGFILGSWHAEQNRLDGSKVATAISKLCTDLNALAKTLSAQQNGLHHRLDIEIVNQLESLLTLDPEVGSRERAVALLSSFQKDAVKIAHAGLIAAGSLKVRISKGGRPPLDWHDDFTELLQRIARKAAITPQLWKDPMDDNGGWLGWLFEASQKLEMFFPSEMRAKTGEAAGKRLERSTKRLEGDIDKTPPEADRVLSM
jgi:hypothetical protein